MLAWSIRARAWRSASKRAITCRESMPALMSLSATSRLTGPSCWAIQTVPMPPSPIGSSSLYAPITVPRRSVTGVSTAKAGRWPCSKKLPSWACSPSRGTMRRRSSWSRAQAASRKASRSAASCNWRAAVKMSRSFMAGTPGGGALHIWRAPPPGVPAMNERDIFTAARQLQDAAERDAFLDAACARDQELRRRIVPLLGEQAQLGSFLEHGHRPAFAVDTPVTERRGTVIGAYKLLEPIGEGGMGTVWMAQQEGPVRRLVALKLIKAGMDSRQVIARFEAERQALALMDHANIARGLDGRPTGAG